MIIQNKYVPKVTYEQCECRLFNADQGKEQDARVFLPLEHCLELEVDHGRKHSFVCSGENLTELCVGWMLSSGIILHPDGLLSLTISEDGHCAAAETDHLQRAESDQEKTGVCFEHDILRIGLDLINHHTMVHEKTHATHSSAVVSLNRSYVLCEDISRTCAVDKAIGMSVLRGLDLQKSVLVCSGRISEEIAYKALRSKIPTIVSNAAPTMQAVRLAEANAIQLVFFASESHHYR